MKKFIFTASGFLLIRLLSFGQQVDSFSSHFNFALTAGFKIFESNLHPNQYNHIHIATSPSIGIDFYSRQIKWGIEIKRDYYLSIYAQNPDFDLNAYYETTLVGIYKQFNITPKFPLSIGADYMWQKQQFLFFWVYPSQGASNYYPFRGINTHAGTKIKWMDVELGYCWQYYHDPAIRVDNLWLSFYYKFQLLHPKQ